MLNMMKKIIKKVFVCNARNQFQVIDLEGFEKIISVICRSGTLDSMIAGTICKEYNIKELISRLQGRPSVILDIGGHIGSFSLMMAAHLEQSQVFVYEVMPQNFRLIRANILLNDLEKRIMPELKVVADTSVAPIFIRSFAKYKANFNTGSQCVAYPSEQRSDSDGELIPSVSVAEIVKNLDRIDVLKIDCEGSEYKILFSLGKAEFEKIDLITGELHDGETFHQFKTNDHAWKSHELLEYLRGYYKIEIHKTTKTSWGFLQTFTATKPINPKT